MPQRIQVVSSGYLGAPGYNTFVTQELGDPGAEALAAAANDFFFDIKAYFSNDTNYVFSGTVENFDEGTGQTLSTRLAGSWNVQGTWGTAKSMPGTALLARWRTGNYRNGREIRGRSFLSGLGQIEDTDGDVPTAIKVIIDSAAQTFVDQAALSVWSPTAGQAFEVDSGNFWERFALIRSRRD